MEISLDNRLYILRSSNLPDDLARKFVVADKLFLRDENDEAEAAINEIERECLVRGISLYIPDAF
ncbi:hypothetical protein [Desulfosporosinus sp.]|uniref:hypothetical protein n=1 Tax=Desulfosporosinus sp. TaxID=157907 RepID=UPI0025B8168D|nr:hypothetical protein [Desulfosporosinus sp.]MBC2726963.1 hypothetical protein [Desulfosporosinus sp.]